MRGYIGSHQNKISNATLRFGDTQLHSPGARLQTERFFLTIEGHVLRFVNTDVVFSPESPLESVIELYLRHGENFVSCLDGLFLIFLCDLRDKCSYVINNRYEAHRLYYHQGVNNFYFSHSLKDLLKTSELQREPDFGSVRSFLANGFTISDRTQIKGVNKLLPADYLVIRHSQGPLVQRKSYWDGEIQFNRRPFTSLEEHLDVYEQTYRAGLERFFSAKKPKSVGTLLSGGHDTSFVVAQATQVLKQPLHAFTVTFPGWKFDESSFAENIAKKFGAIYHPVPFGAEHLDSIVSLIQANEEPVVGSSLPLHVLAQQASSQVDTLLGGDGGDTLWAEYYPVAEYHRWTHHLPLYARQLLSMVAQKLRVATDWERFWELEHVAKLFAEEGYHEDFLRKLCTYRHFSDEFQQSLLSPDITENPYAKSHTQIPFTDKNFSEALIEGKLFNGFYTYQSFHTAKSAKHYGMELFLPTIDKGVIDFITSLPKEWINGGHALQRLTNNKVINRKFHKKALSRYLSPNEIYNRSFDIPWYKILLPRKHLLNKLRTRLIKRGWYQKATLDRLFDEFSTQQVKNHELLELKNHGYRIFTLLSLEIWCIEYLDGRFSSTDKHFALEDYLE